MNCSKNRQAGKNLTQTQFPARTFLQRIKASAIQNVANENSEWKIVLSVSVPLPLSRVFPPRKVASRMRVLLHSNLAQLMNLPEARRVSRMRCLQEKC